MYHMSSSTYFTTLAVLSAIISSGQKSQNGSTTKSSSKTLLVHALAKQAYALGGLNVEDKIFMPYGFISLATCTTSILSWILGKFISKPKRAHIYTKRCQAHDPKPMAILSHQSLWFKLMAQHLIFDSWSKLMSLIGEILGVMVWRAKKYVQ